MTKPDRSDDDDFYDHGFDRDGFVSVWAGKTDLRLEPEIDVLQELCGVGYYRLSDQEGNRLDYEEVPLQALLKDISYSKLFMDNVLRAAEKKGIFQACWVVLQYEFHYDPAKVTRPGAAKREIGMVPDAQHRACRQVLAGCAASGVPPGLSRMRSIGRAARS